MNGKNLPEKKFSCGGITATIWKNQVKGARGDAIYYYSVSLDRRYKDKEGNWKSTNSYRIMDLPKVNMLMTKAFEFTSLRDNGQANGQNYDEIPYEAIA